MPAPNNFRHQCYTTVRPSAPFRLLRADGPCKTESEFFTNGMRNVGIALRRANVGKIILAHGTFAGPDAFGVIENVALIFGSLSRKLKSVAKRLIDALAGDAGNFTGEYVEILQTAINVGIDPESAEFIPVERFLWSSENNHMGRADGAVRMVEFLAGSKSRAGSRTLLLGHSHGGNVFALMTNLLNAKMGPLDEFFSAAKPYYTIPATKIVDAPHWPRVRTLLMDDGDEARQSRAALRAQALDLVTLGTPIRYGWDLSGDRRLLHMVNHKPHPECPDFLGYLPQSAAELTEGEFGDLIHLIGIAGSNIIPSLISPRAILADQRLSALLQPGISRTDLLKNIKCRMRVAEQGTSLLVDYALGDRNLIRTLAGHAVYTRIPWMEFQLRTIAAAFYPQSTGAK